jgi:hypothetical protein
MTAKSARPARLNVAPEPHPAAGKPINTVAIKGPGTRLAPPGCVQRDPLARGVQIRALGYRLDSG